MNSLDKLALRSCGWMRFLFWCKWFGHCNGGVGKSSVYVNGKKAKYLACYVCRKPLYAYGRQLDSELNNDCKEAIKNALNGEEEK